MGLELAKVFVKVRGDTSLLRGDLNKSKGPVIAAATGIATSVRSILSSAFAGFGVILGVQAFATFIRSGEEFNRKMRGSLAIMGEVSEALRVDMKQAAIEAARSTVFSASQAAESFFFLASAGLDAKQSIAALPQVALFAQAGMFDMARATDLATDAQSAMGLTVEDAAQNLTNLTRVTDVLVKANTLANASVEQFSVALTTKAAAAARNAGISIESTVSTLAAFADQGIKGQIAGSAFAIVLRELQTRSLQNKDAFKAAGIAVFDASGNMRDMADIIEDLENKLEGMSAEQKKLELAQLGFMDKSVGFIQSLLGMSDAIRGYTKELQDAGGVTKEVSDKQMTPMQKGLAQLGVAFIKLGDIVSRALGPMVQLIGENVETLFKMASALIAAKAAIIVVNIAIQIYTARLKVAATITSFLIALSGPGGWVAISVAILAAGGALLAMNAALAETKKEIEDIQKQDEEQQRRNKKKDEKKKQVPLLTPEQTGITEFRPDLFGGKQLTGRLGEMQEELFRIKNALTEAEVARREFSQTNKDATEKDIETFRQLQDAIDIGFAQAGEVERIRLLGRELTEAMMTPVEQMGKTVEQLRRLFRAGAISQRTLNRALAKEREKFKIDVKTVPEGRFGAADFGRQIQNLVLQREDPAKAQLAEQVRTTGVLDKMHLLMIKAEKRNAFPLT